MGVKTTADFKGKTLGVWFFGNEFPFYAWMAKLGLPTAGGADGVNVLKQNFNTDDMAHSIAKSIAFVSSIHALLPGDILATGTNHRGLHAIQDGDRLELEVDGLGRLAVNVRDTVERAWPRETRLERQTAGLDGMAPQASGKYASA